MTRRATGSLFRRVRDGKPEDRWTISFRANGRRITERAYTDKAASEQLLAQRLREAARDEVGMTDPYRKQRRAPVSEHLDAFLDGIASRNRTSKHHRMTKARLKRAFKEMGATRLDGLTLEAAERFLAGLLRAGDAPRTRDHYALALRQFGAWLVDAGRAAANPFHRLRGVARQADARRERMAVTLEQLLLLVEAAEVRPIQRYRASHPRTSAEFAERLMADGWCRGSLYLFSALTGLRRAECAAIRWADLDLTEGAGWVTPRAATTKAKRLEPLPLIEFLAARLRELRTRAARDGRSVPAPTARVFHVPRWLPEQLRKDAAHAKIPLVDDDGRRLDFHSLRASLATICARLGVPQQVARRLMRHTTAAMTARHYEKLDREDLRAGSEQVAAALAVAAEVAASRMRGGAQECASVRDEQHRKGG